MNVIWLLVKASSLNVANAVLTGLISGGCSARLIVLINTAISGNSTENLMWYFVGLALVAMLTGVISQFLLIDLAQGAVYKLRLRLSNLILSAPLRQLEELGANRLLATLTEDVQSLSKSVFAIPFICIDFAVVAGCLIYLGWLSGVVFLIVVVFIGLAIACVQLLLNKAYQLLALAREEEDRLYKHFRSITEGIKELKLHAKRRQEFLDEGLLVSATVSRHSRTSAFKIGAIAVGFGQLLFFTILGLLLFGLPRIITITAPVLAAYALTITYLLVPIQNILDRLPTLLDASVAVRKTESMGLALASLAETATMQSVPNSTWTILELEQVTHTYRSEQEDSHFIVGPLSLVFSTLR